MSADENYFFALQVIVTISLTPASFLTKCEHMQGDEELSVVGAEALKERFRESYQNFIQKKQGSRYSPGL